MEKEIDYKEMYLKMVRASEQAIRFLIKAQQECEELCLSLDDAGEKRPKLILLPSKEAHEITGD